MKYAKASATISGYRREIADIRHKMRKAMAEIEAETVADYEFTTVTGVTRLSELFGAPLSPGDDFCTLWHFFDLLPGGAAGWTPKFSYS